MGGGRKRDNLVRDFFHPLPNEKKNKFVKFVGPKFEGDNVSNLRRHLDVAHQESFVAAKEEIASGSSAPKKKQTVSVKIDASQDDIKDALFKQ